MSKINIIIRKDSKINKAEYSVTTGGLLKVVLPSNTSDIENVSGLYSYIASNKTTLSKTTKKSLENFRKQLLEMLERCENELNLKNMGFYAGTSLRIAQGNNYSGMTVARVGLEYQISWTINPISSLLAMEDLEIMVKKQLSRAVMTMIDGSENIPIFFCDIYHNGEKMEKPYDDLDSEKKKEYFAIAEEVYDRTSKIEKTEKYRERLREVSIYQTTSLNV